jgi:enoyl-CoA hydratase/carnithine racemase
MTEPLALYRTDEKVGVVTMNRPEKLNALSPELKAALWQALKDADADPDTTVVLLRGAGRSFCVGYDIGNPDPAKSGWRSDPLKWHEHLHESLQFECAPWNMKKPIIAQVQGHALGGGCELAMMCDMTVAAEDAKFGEPEIRFSAIGPAMVMPWFIGLKKARELLYFGDMIDAPAALALGMINRVVPPAELDTVAMKFAKRLTLISPEALYYAKASINRGAEVAGLHDALKAGVDVLAPIYAAQTEMGRRFKEITAEQGLGAALKWRGNQFRDAG